MSGMHASCALLYRYDAVVEIRDSLTVDLAERKETIKAMHQAEVAKRQAQEEKLKTLMSQIEQTDNGAVQEKRARMAADQKVRDGRAVPKPRDINPQPSRPFHPSAAPPSTPPGPGSDGEPREDQGRSRRSVPMRRAARFFSVSAGQRATRADSSCNLDCDGAAVASNWRASSTRR